MIRKRFLPPFSVKRVNWDPAAGNFTTCTVRPPKPPAYVTLSRRPRRNLFRPVVRYLFLISKHTAFHELYIFRFSAGANVCSLVKGFWCILLQVFKETRVDGAENQFWQESLKQRWFCLFECVLHSSTTDCFDVFCKKCS